MRREYHKWFSAHLSRDMELLVFGHAGDPVLFFPTRTARFYDYEDWQVIDALRKKIETGAIQIYCLDSVDKESFYARDVHPAERIFRYFQYERYVLEEVIPFVQQKNPHSTLIAAGCSLGAYHAANFALKRADLFPLALCFSGNYDPASWNGWGERGVAAYFNNPIDYVGHLDGDHLAWLRERVSLLLVCGQGMWEDSTGSLPSTRQFAALLGSKQLRHELDLWGFDVPHDWPSWRAQLAHHLPRFC